MRLLPAPAGVPVEGFVGIGFVRPLTLRPVSGVCASSLSRPVPPALSFVEGPALSERPGRRVEGPALSERPCRRVEGPALSERPCRRVEGPAFRVRAAVLRWAGFAAFRVLRVAARTGRRLAAPAAAFFRFLPAGVFAPAVRRPPFLPAFSDFFS